MRSWVDDRFELARAWLTFTLPLGDLLARQVALGVDAGDRSVLLGPLLWTAPRHRAVALTGSNRGVLSELNLVLKV